MFPVGVFGVAISIAAHPVMARQAATGSLDDLKKSYVSTLTIAFCLTIPATIGLIMLAEPIIRIIFQHGRFDAFATTMTAQALTYYMIGLFAYSSAKITVPVFYNINLTRYPVMGSFLAVAVNITVILLTIDYLQHRALALSISCAMTANFLFLFTILYYKLEGFSITYLLTGFLKVLVAGAVMAGWLLALDKFMMGNTNDGINFLFDLFSLTISIMSGALVYGIILYALQLAELKTIIDLVITRVKGH
jgi:putative peptidoglycan lipid II flippase